MTQQVKRAAAFCVAIAVLLAASTVRANEPSSERAAPLFQWSTLAPENGKPFIDPFMQLSSNQLADLSYVVQIRRLIAEEKIHPDGKDAKDAAELAGQLNRQGIDIGWMIEQRERVRQIRGMQVDGLSKSIAGSLQGQKISLVGYVIPTKIDDDRLTEFLLVPTIAACSHEDAPPRLQVVLVSTQCGIEMPGRRAAVRVTAAIVAESSERTTVNGNGRVKVHAAYGMKSAQVDLLPNSAFRNALRNHDRTQATRIGNH